MKQTLLFFSWLLIVANSWGQITSKQVDSFYAKYPTVKSNFCPACKEWDNPFFKSIADTQRHMPLVEHELYTKANTDKIPSVKIPRTGIYAAWHPAYKQVDETKVYIAANVIARANKDLIAKGHVQCWVLNSFSPWAAIVSDTYTFNAGFEDQSQNVGTQIATENITRTLLKTVDVEVWGGTFGSQGTFTDGKTVCTYPSHYWKIIKSNGNMQCYWMPNLKTETQEMLPKRIVTFEQLIISLGFDPTKVLK